MAPLNIGGPVNLAIAATSLGLILIVGVVFYNIFLHPLRSFPGPLLWRISPIPRSYWLVRGKLAFKVAELHAKYGPFVRMGPNELTICNAEAWNDIHGHRRGGAAEFPKYPELYNPSNDRPHTILFSGRDEHAALRRALAHGFSERSMRGQEPIIGEYVNHLIRSLRTNCEGGQKALNMREWFNWTTFDVIGDLGFGSGFGCLDDSNYHPWIRLITKTIRIDAFFGVMNDLGLKTLVRWLKYLGGLKVRKEHMELVTAKLRQRMEVEIERPDFLEGLLKKKKELNLSEAELVENAAVLILAGSETTATLLSGVTFLLTTHPDKLAKVAEEVRSTFKSEEEITLISVSRLPYMLACLNEALRCYPPVATGLPRLIPKGGAHIAGKLIPENARVAIWQWAINHDARYWTEPYNYVPERFLGDPRFKGDRLDAMQPFSTGPRNCIGQNLAYAEMRLILAKVLWNFDMAIEDDSRDWLKDQPVYNLWEKPALNVRMTPVDVK